jgi:hypothetical protein
VSTLDGAITILLFFQTSSPAPQLFYLTFSFGKHCIIFAKSSTVFKFSKDPLKKSLRLIFVRVFTSIKVNKVSNFDPQLEVTQSKKSEKSEEFNFRTNSEAFQILGDATQFFFNVFFYMLQCIQQVF